MATRFPGEKVEYKYFQAKVDFNPVTGEPHGIMIWRNDKCTHELDDDLDELCRQISRVMQRRKP